MGARQNPGEPGPTEKDDGLQEAHNGSLVL